MDENPPIHDDRDHPEKLGIKKPMALETVLRPWTPQESVSCKGGIVVDADQLTSLNAMVSYIAHKSGQSEFRIERNLADHFKIPNAKLLAAKDFNNAIRYLADILPH